MINDEIRVLDEMNRPNYLGKALLGESIGIGIQSCSTQKLERLFISTDGIFHLAKHLENHGNDVDPLKTLFDRPDFFENPIALSKYLADLTDGRQILQDDTTLIMLQKRK